MQSTVEHSYEIDFESIKESVLDGDDYAEKSLEFYEHVKSRPLSQMSMKQKQWLERIEERWPI